MWLVTWCPFGHAAFVLRIEKRILNFQNVFINSFIPHIYAGKQYKKTSTIITIMVLTYKRNPSKICYTYTFCIIEREIYQNFRISSAPNQGFPCFGSHNSFFLDTTTWLSVTFVNLCKKHPPIPLFCYHSSGPAVVLGLVVTEVFQR